MALKPNALASLAQAKAHLGITPSDVLQDAKLELFINAASERIERHCDRLFISRGTIEELQHGRRSNILISREFPIIAISELWIDQSSQFTDTNLILSAFDYGKADDDTTVLLFKTVFPTGYNNIKIKYTAGYLADELPTDLTLACLWLVEWFYRQNSRQDMGRTTASKNGENYAVLTKMPDQVAEILMDYTRVEMPLLNSPVYNL